ncbi:iron transporter FeoA [Euryarchaeota archaeon ex4484_162]|nr:ferrous iron transport protein A [Thermoplasmata archaeon]OYT56819.1 MAG: iron transporter FeoA [Euryarchaeota archaeon ex4484_162]HDO70139.1 ferrous iron transport protein A [Thermoplasmatales archaeon]RLF30757.1 MAG: ferrous iron transport protein A [Thermoplasmata archaeon]RLF60541.1 MAG: ferrous iron transport protein A [Thermoplasmata archaeon]
MIKNIIPLLNLREGKEGKIVELRGGFGFQRKIRVMGLREGKKIRIVSIQPAGGPITIEAEGNMVTIGRGMAQRIFVEVE